VAILEVVCCGSCAFFHQLVTINRRLCCKQVFIVLWKFYFLNDIYGQFRAVVLICLLDTDPFRKC